MQLVCVATHSAGYFPVLEKTAAIHGMDLVPLGWGQTWRGFAWKFRLLEDHLGSRHVDPDDIVVVIDAFDVIVVADAADVERRFVADFQGKPIVFSTEQEPPGALARYAYNHMFPACRHRDVRLNGGAYAGRAWALRDMLAYFRAELGGFSDRDDDQKFLAKLCATPFFDEHCAVDLQSRLFHNWWATNARRPFGPLVARDTCFVHCPGDGDMRPVIAHYYQSVADGRVRSERGLLTRVRTYAPLLIPEISTIVVAFCVVVVAAIWAFKSGI